VAGRVSAAAPAAAQWQPAQALAAAAAARWPAGLALQLSNVAVHQRLLAASASAFVAKHPRMAFCSGSEKTGAGGIFSAGSGVTAALAHQRRTAVSGCYVAAAKAYV